MRRLSEATLGDLPADVAVPGYDRAAVGIGVVHLGLGAFHRAHQAVVFDRVLRAGDLRWGICGVSMRSPDVRDALAPQDGLYCVVERDGADERVRVIGSIVRVLVAPEDPEAVVAALAAPEVRLVTLTVTEAGYRLRAGRLDLDHPDIRHDLAHPDRPRTPVGFVAAGLARRRAIGLPPFALLSCDNLPGNGPALRDAVAAFASRRDPALADHVRRKVDCPASVVDRIVPATTPEDVAALVRRIGVEDRAMVKTEPFLQWVVGDALPEPRPPVDRHGATLTRDVAAWERAKLGLLNGAHSAMAYLGRLASMRFVDEVASSSGGGRFLGRLWDEIAATLRPTPGLDLAAYRADLAGRFGNAALGHRLDQIAIDGSQKLPQRIVAPLLERAKGGRASPALLLVVAAWVLWIETCHAVEGPDSIRDVRAVDLAAAIGHAGPAARVRALLSSGLSLAAGDVALLVDDVVAARADLVRRGAARVLREGTIDDDATSWGGETGPP